MAYCTKCGMEIEDGKELCANCNTKEDRAGESYLDQLLNSFSQNPIEEEPPLPELDLTEEEESEIEEKPEEEFPLPELDLTEEEEPEVEEEPEEEFSLPDLDLNEGEDPEIEEEPEEEFSLPELDLTQEEEPEVEEEPEEEFSLPDLDLNEGEDPEIQEEPEEEFSLPELDLTEEEEPEEEFPLPEMDLIEEEDPETEKEIEEEFPFPEMDLKEEEPEEELPFPGTEMMEEETLQEDMLMEAQEENEADLSDLMDLISGYEEDLEESSEENVSPELTEAETQSPEDIDIGLDDLFDSALSVVAEDEGKEAEENSSDQSLMEESHDLSLDDVLSIGDESEEEEIPQESDEEDAEQLQEKVEKKPSFFQKLKAKYFDNIIDEKVIAEEEAAIIEEEKEEEEKKKKAEEEEKTKEELKLQKEEEKEQRKKEKEEKEAEKKKLKEEKLQEKKKRKEEEEKQYVGHINPVGAAIVILFFFTIGIFSYFGMQMISHRNYISSAESYYDAGEYTKAYTQLAGVSLSESEKSLYQKTRLLAKIQQTSEAYERYLEIKLPLEALNSLVNGVKKYDVLIGDAKELKVKEEANKLIGNIEMKLRESFGMTLADARKINNESNTVEEYAKKIEEKVSSFKGK